MVRPYWKRLAGAMALMVLVGASTSAMAYLVKPVMDKIFVARDSDLLMLMPIGIIVLYTVKGLSSYGQTYLMQYVGQRIVTQFRIDLYAHLQRLSLSYYDRTPTGELMSRITNDVNQMQGAVSSVVTGVLKDMFTIVGLVAVIVYRDWFLAVFALGVFPLCVIPLVKFGRRLRKISHRSQETMADVTVLLHETIGGARIVKGFCREEYETQRFTDEAFRLFRLRMKDISTRAMSSPLMEFLGGLGIAGILFYGGWQVIHGVSTPGTFFSFLTALILLYEPVKRLSSMNNDVQNGLAAAERVYRVLDEPVEIAEKTGAVELAPLQKEIVYHKVSFAYRPGEPVLKEINLTVPKGQAVALVGTSGGGKTTLVNLLPRFYEVTEGSISIDGTDIRQATLGSLRGQIAIVTQQTILFNDTVRNNIAYGRPEASDDEVRAAAEAAYATKFIEQMPHGLDTRIGESGVLLSGGERQRLSIARALLADRPILILDEATSSLDTESEMYVQKALENLMAGRTTFVIAHRLSTVQRADRILVISGGHIVEEGRHDELVAMGGVYTRLHRMQFAIDQGLEAIAPQAGQPAGEGS
ncbi:MAG: lipid A export permease/ATP-binding protein MsbA [Desulfarculus sp.]|nr:lipid A export permease/ATP-binding protein MsbA [Pseudomonadota bacterium]MBV1714711.1 lipid A export permease/ATP-binding protein MsbA [Desulfarculus sp.]MBU4574411.1 lipid A export permease/ATP-binding protein MsbA [Pseudomonadota bacterium]MBU4600047.1 lipid A export permease/ATP-binding protein MsbA [Pseudomonadota bacterium]MBV1736993.1 lipid A export permease/ATP-binding protein MsbA [Desulfarculus sp.]